MQARVTVTLKAGVLDPQGKAIEGALRSLGLSGFESVRQGKLFDVELGGSVSGSCLLSFFADEAGGVIMTVTVVFFRGMLSKDDDVFRGKNVVR